MKIQTVLGPIDPEKLGVTLFHEHLIADFMCWWLAPSEASKLNIVDDRFGIEHISELRRGIGFIKDNYTLTDVQLAIKELQYYTRAQHNIILSTYFQNRALKFGFYNSFFSDKRARTRRIIGWKIDFFKVQ